MKRRVLVVLLCAVLALALLPAPARAEERLTFIAINDTMPPELVNGVVSHNGMLYVPYFTFSNYGLGLSYTYFSNASTAYLYTRDKQLFFELVSGKTYDGDDTQFSAPAIMRGGVVYLPLSTVYWYFGGFSYSNIAGNEYGSILRITTGDVVLSDQELLKAARNIMRNYYVSYNQALQQMAEAAATTPPPATETPRPSETPDTHEGERLTLSFAGLPPPRLLETLAQRGWKTSFFLTAEDVTADPDLVRRVAGEGHGLGVYVRDPDARSAWDETAALLFEAARVRPLLLAAPAGGEADAAARDLAAAEGLVYCRCDYDGETGAYLGGVRPWLESDPLAPSLRLGGGNAWNGTQEILQYLYQQKYDVVRPRETTG